MRHAKTKKTLWLARDKDGTLCLYAYCPTFIKSRGEYSDEHFITILLKKEDIYPEVRYGDDPVAVKADIILEGYTWRITH